MLEPHSKDFYTKIKILFICFVLCIFNHFIPPENMRKSLILRCFRRYWNGSVAWYGRKTFQKTTFCSNIKHWKLFLTTYTAGQYMFKMNNIEVRFMVLFLLLSLKIFHQLNQHDQKWTNSCHKSLKLIDFNLFATK